MCKTDSFLGLDRVNNRCGRTSNLAKSVGRGLWFTLVPLGRKQLDNRPYDPFGRPRA